MDYTVVYQKRHFNKINININAHSNTPRQPENAKDGQEAAGCGRRQLTPGEFGAFDGRGYKWTLEEMANCLLRKFPSRLLHKPRLHVAP